jgi:hypothetical protein
MEEYRHLRSAPRPRRVPVENTGGPATADGHWRETIFRNELMSGFIEQPGNPVSRLTVASLADLGYAGDLDAAEPYALPDVFALAESGSLVAHVAPRLDRPQRSGEPDGALAAGTPVSLLVEGSERCRVVDPNGLYVEVRRTSLRAIPHDRA